ncbi:MULTISPECIES: hypothetical protein [Novosphingopyxis]|mgnify:FL=1|uniref:hypothetical protein n=1 Tax=Novosphingopyxis TaxID=2709686 RepID=UPI001FEB3061|nr:hypothetical protein [Novosphingopyxis iocasae]
MAASKAPARRYLRRLSTAMAIYLLSLFAGEYLIERDLVSGPVTWVLALLPGLAIIGAFWAIAMLIVETEDEFIRMLMVRQVMIGTGFALSIATIWGFLENFELVPHVDAYWVAILWFGGFGLGACVNRLTHGAWGNVK